MHVLKVDFNKAGDDFLIVGPFARKEHADTYRKMVVPTRWPVAVKVEEYRLIETDMLISDGRDR